MRATTATTARGFARATTTARANPPSPRGRMRKALFPRGRRASEESSSSTSRPTPTTPRATNVPTSSGFNGLEDLASPFVKKHDALNEGIASFYGESSELWEDIWGEHMHHGYYPNGVARADHRQAQVDMVDNALEWAGVTDVKRALDVGCGIGGGSRHLSRKFGCAATGVTLSPVQAARANEITADAADVDESLVRVQVADALHTPFEDAAFDLVYSMESGEHMPDKEAFVNELARVCAPGGQILIVTWCHRVLDASEKELPPDERSLLDRICEAYYLPPWCSVATYEKHFASAGLVDVRTEDWSREVSPFWRAVIETALTRRGVIGLLKAGPSTIRGGLVMPLMSKGLRDGTIKFNLITARKP